MTASMTSAAVGLTNNLSKVKQHKYEQNNAPKSSNSEPQNQLESTNKLITVNPFLNDFFDCIENLPSKLQILISELRSVDAQVNAHHRKLQLVKQAIFAKVSSSDDKKTNQDISSESSITCYESYSIGELLNLLHKILAQCQIFGDQKVKLTSQIMETLSIKTRQLGFDSETYEERNFQIELDEEKIINEFKMSIKKRSLRHHYNCSSSGARGNTGRTNNGGSSFHSTSQQLAARSQKNLVDINKFKSTKGLFSPQSTTRNSSQLDAYLFDENPAQSIYQNNINNSLRNLNNSNSNLNKSNKNSIRHKPAVVNSFSSSKKMVLNNSNNKNTNNKSTKKLRLEPSSLSGSSTNNSPFLPSKLALFKHQHESTDDNSNLTRPKRQLGPQTPEEISMSKKRRLNQLKQSICLNNNNNSNHNSNQCKSPSSSTSSYSSSNSKNETKRLNGAVNSPCENHKNNKKKLKKSNSSKQIIKKHFSNIINDEQQQQQRSTPEKKNKELINKKLLNRNNRMHADNTIDSEEYENYDINDNKMANTHLLPTYEDLNEKNADQLDELNERNSNETESINHIDNDEDDDDMGDLNSDYQLDEDDNGSFRCNEDAESNVGDDEQEDDDDDDQDDDENNNEDDEDEDEEKNNDGIDDDENELDDYNEDEPIENNTDQDDEEDASFVNENDLDENSENRSYAINHQPNKGKTNRNSKTLNSATIPTNSTSTNTNQNNINTANEDEETYCTCEQISYGQMICCDNKACKIEWFHFNCVKLTTKPKGKWFCPNCRGDTHKIMKKTANKTHLSSSNYSNFNSSNNNNSGYHSSYRAK